MRNGQYSHQKVLLMKNPQFLSKYDETLPKCLQHELVKNAKFHQISTKIEHFSLIVLSGVCIVRFASVSISFKNNLSKSELLVKTISKITIWIRRSIVQKIPKTKLFNLLL